MRDAVYGYLVAVFEIVERYERRGITPGSFCGMRSDLGVLQVTASLTHLPPSFAALAAQILTTRRSVNGRGPFGTSLSVKSPGTGLKIFMEEAGGINGLGRALRETFGAWQTMRVVQSIRHELPC